MNFSPIRLFCTAVLIITIVIPITLVGSDAKQPLTLPDIMKFKEIQSTVIADNGTWVAYSVQPGRGNGAVLVVNPVTGKSFRIADGSNPIITGDGKWAAAAVLPDFTLTAEDLKDKKAKKNPKNQLALLNTGDGKVITINDVKTYAFSKNSLWLSYRLYAADKKEKENVGEKEEKREEKEEKSAPVAKPEPTNSDDKADEQLKSAPLILYRLDSGTTVTIPDVTGIAFDPSSRFIAYVVKTNAAPAKTEADKSTGDKSTAVMPTPVKKENGVYVRDLQKETAPELAVHTEAKGRYSHLTWSKKNSRLAFIFLKDSSTTTSAQMITAAKTENAAAAGKLWDDKGEFYISSLITWDGLKNKRRDAVNRKRTPAGLLLPADNYLEWTDNGQRLFFGFKPVPEYIRTHPRKKDPESKKAEDRLYDIDGLLQKRGVDVWHWQDPLINPHQKKEWEALKKRVYKAVYHYDEDRFVPLADAKMERVDINGDSMFVLGSAYTPYYPDRTWDGNYRDVYYVNLKTGNRNRILTRHQYDAVISPLGGYVVYYKEKHWHLYNAGDGSRVNLTAATATPFFNEDHDYPADVPGYRVAGWSEKDLSLLIYDKYDVWEFFPASGTYHCLTDGQGRKNRLSFRVVSTDPEQTFFTKNQRLLLAAYSHKEKFTAFYNCRLGKPGVKRLLEMKDRSLSFITKAKHADSLIFTRENFQEFPDLWYATGNLSNVRKISDVNPQIKTFLWGSAQLITWLNNDGKETQGVAILPENYDPGKRYPVLVYYYRFFSQQLHHFNQVTINHRPCFPYYTGNGYVVFLPDITFEIGRPGSSAVKSLVPGVQKLIQMGIADPKAVGLHGHSWSGYQTAYVITQTRLFAAAIAGAPVSNMTSAYNGIRWGSGMARQFQYEKSQSRIGTGLVQAPHLYIENSPVFFADRIDTPLLIEFGDKDEAVPWYQGIELYLTMRRLNKNCIFLQYNDEPHHLKKYPNKLDYTIKMKQFLDHYLKGAAAPKWMTEGVPFEKK